MSEIVKTYLLDDPDTMIPMDRKEFYAEQIETFRKVGKPSRAVEVIQIFLFNTAGEIFTQKRSNDKSHNPGMLDKSIGGHVQYQDDINYTVMVETVQELQVPSIVLRTDEDFDKTHKLLKNYLNTLAIIKHSASKIRISKKIINKEKVEIANKFHLFFGAYGGSVKMVDREAKGILTYTLPDLEQEMQQFGDMFTHDLHFFVREYKPQIETFIQSIQEMEEG